MQMTDSQRYHEEINRQAEQIEALEEQLDRCERENEALSNALEALFFFARAEIARPLFSAFVAEHEELGRMFPIVEG